MKRAIATLALTLAACASDAEQFVVVVDTDLTIPEDAIGIDVLATAQGGASSDGATFALPETPLPISLGVLPPEDGSPLVVEVTALDDAGNDVVLRRAIVGFPPVGRMRIPMFIASACRGVACGESETCTEVGCAPAELTEDQLGSVPEEAETDLCRPGPGQCNESGTGYEVCERYGDPPVVVECGADQHCDAATVACVDDAKGPTDTVTLQVNKVGGGAGHVQSTSGAIDCGATCLAEVEVGSSVTLQGTPDNNSAFAGWEAAPCTGSGDCTFVLMNDTILDARFEVRQTSGQHDLQVNLHGGGNGRIYSEPAGIDCRNAMCTGSFPANTRVTLRHEAGATSGFAGWFGDCGGVDNCVVTMDGPRYVAGSFMHDDGSARVELLVGYGGTGEGHVTSNPAGIDCGTQCSYMFARNATVELYATPEPGGSTFKGWEGACTGNGTCVVDMATAREVFAIFDTDVPVAIPRDLNGDGYEDLVFGAPGVDAGTQADVGRVYVMFGPKSQSAMGINQVDRSYQGAAPGSGFGSSIAVGDLDGDGYEDLAIGAPGESGRGAVHILFGGPGLVGSGMVGGGTGPVLAGMSNGDAFGAALAIEDLDVDGIGDLIVGAPGVDGNSVGQVFVFAGQPGFWPSTTDFVAHLTAQSAGTEFGRSVAMIGDIDYDGWPDLAIGEPKYAPASVAEGRVAVYMSPANTAMSPTAPTFTLSGGSDAEAYGWSIVGLLDFNRDGLEDFAISSPVKDMVHVYFGRTSWTSNAAPDLRLAQVGMFGSALAGGDDVTGDGYPDLVATAPMHMGSVGRVYVYEGAAAPSTQPYAVIEGSCVNAMNCAREELGLTVDIGADINGDFVADIVVGSRFGGMTAGQPNRGRITAYPLGNYPMTMAPIPSGNADVLVVGEDQAGGLCAALPGSSVLPEP